MSVEWNLKKISFNNFVLPKTIAVNKMYMKMKLRCSTIISKWSGPGTNHSIRVMVQYIRWVKFEKIFFWQLCSTKNYSGEQNVYENEAKMFHYNFQVVRSRTKSLNSSNGPICPLSEIWKNLLLTTLFYQKL